MIPSPQRTAQLPVLQLWPLAQLTAEKLSPSVPHVWRDVALAHVVVALPGVQVRSVHAPAPVQA